MKMTLILSLVTLSSLMVSQPVAQANDSIFGRSGSGQPTKTVVGLLGGAALGTAIGQAVDDKDGWWIGALTGSVVGGAAGNAWGAEDSDNRYASRSYHSRSYSHRSYGYQSVSSTCYDPYPDYTPVVYEREVVVEQVPVVIVPSVEEQREAARRESVKAVWPVDAPSTSASSASTSPQETPAKDNTGSVPYGHTSAGTGQVKSPWSDFALSTGGKSPGQIVYDANTGQPFRIP